MDTGLAAQDFQERLRTKMLARTASRQGTSVRSAAAGLALLVYLYWSDPNARTALIVLVIARLLTAAATLLLSRRIVTQHRRGLPILQLETALVTVLTAGGASWGLMAYLVPDLNYVDWRTQDMLAAVALVLVSSLMLITQAHHRRAMTLSLSAQWLVVISAMHLEVEHPQATLLIGAGILTLLTVLVLHGRMLNDQTRKGVAAELRNEELTERLRRSNTDLAQALDQAVEAASRDALTGVFNRRALYQRADYLATVRRRQGWPGVVLLMDIDHFKRINDSYGHAAGDLVLTDVAEALRSELREMDVVARWGGEEFLVLMPHCDLATAAQRAEELRASVSRLRVRALPVGREVRVSIGVADWPAGEPLDPVIARADRALYQAKAGGRDRVMLAA